MRGSIQKKCNRWHAVVDDGVNPATGQYRRPVGPAGTRRGDAEKLLAVLVKRSHQDETVVIEKLTLGEYLTTRWLPVQEALLRRSTYDSYRRNIELHVTGTSRHTIGIDEGIVQVLRDWYKARIEERVGVEPAADDLVSVKADGSSTASGHLQPGLRPHRGKDRVPAIFLTICATPVRPCCARPGCT